jgi:uncharacterized protein (DUF302 family)
LAARTRRWTTAFLGALAAVLMALTPPMASAENAGIVSTTVKASFESTATKLKKAITANKLIIVKEVPFTTMLSMVGVKAEKMKGFEIFHPRYGKVIYGKDKSAFLEAPLRLLLQDKGGEIEIRYRKPSVVFSGYSGLAGLGADLDKVFAHIVESAAN